MCVKNHKNYETSNRLNCHRKTTHSKDKEVTFDEINFADHNGTLHSLNKV